jgi:hypothetical protein
MVPEPSLIFGGRRFVFGEVYSYDDLPQATRRDILAQEDDLQARFGTGARTLHFRLVLVPHDDLVRELHLRYGAGLEDAMAAPEVAALAHSIARYGLQYPPVGEEGWTRALAMAALGSDMPYFEILEPFETGISPAIPTLDGPAKESSEELPPAQAKEMREGFWRMMQRISLGIPGFIGSGEITGRVGVDNQFVGGLAGVRTAWLLRPFGMQLFETVPLAGIYLFGMFWPQILRYAGISRGKSDNFSKSAERLQKEFGMTVEYDLLKGTVPFPQRGEGRVEEITRELEGIEKLKERIKEREMIYQVDAKEEVAIAKGLPLTAYHNLSYKDWGAVWKEYTKGRSEEWLREHGMR